MISPTFGVIIFAVAQFFQWSETLNLQEVLLCSVHIFI
jgi:hypothetical protein